MVTLFVALMFIAGMFVGWRAKEIALDERGKREERFRNEVLQEVSRRKASD